VDSTESIKVITNEETGWQILLRHKDDLKYGFKRDSQWKDTLDCEEIDYDNIGMEVQQDEKIICGYNCRKYIFKTEEIISEAWITRDLDFTLSKYFPEFLQKDASFSFYQFRKRVDCEGFVMNYWEKDLISDEELKLEIQVFESEVPDYKFYYDSGYHVLDAEGMRQLYLDSRNDIQKKKLWDEFMQLFGK
jgi:hypothetical protein